MRKVFSLFVLIITIESFSFTANSQESHLISKVSDNISLFGIHSEENDSIYFLRISKDTSLTAKPSLIFLQGSLPIPLIVQEDEYFIPSLNFDYLTVAEKYNIIVISKPFTPAIANVKQLNNQYCYVPDIAYPKQYDTLYLKNNYREKYISRTNDVIEFLQHQKWITKDQISIIGHSEGTSVAIGVAKSNQSIKAVGYLSGNPMGRYAQYIYSQRNAETKGLQTAEKSQDAIDLLYKRWNKICYSSEDLSSSDPNRTWTSFSKSIINEITDLKCPIFIGYGTEDSGGQFCDYMPIYFDIAQKTNYKLSPYIGRGHNFEKIVEGKPDFNDMIWEKVMADFLLWLESIR